MGRTSRIVTSALLIGALAAVSVPLGLQLVPALLPQDPAAVAVVPAAQMPPTTIGDISTVSPLVSTAPLPDTDKLASDLKTALAFEGKGTFGMQVADAATGQELFSQDGGTAMIAASNLKLLTAGAVLKTLGANTRFSTQAVAGASANEIVLRAGGDSMLATGPGDTGSVMGHAGLATLARQTAGALAAAGVAGPVTLTIDDTLFVGAALNPKWTNGDVAAGEIAPIHPMALYGGRRDPEVLTGPRPQDSAVSVAVAFVDALETAGVATSGTITRGKAPSGGSAKPAAPTAAGSAQPGSVLGSVDSATVAQQTQYMLDESDNYVAEVLGRMVAVKLGLEASNAGAVAGVRQVVTGLGLSLEGVITTDNCGLATGSRISPQKLVQLLSLLLADPGSDIGQALAGLPIAGLTGTLDDRFETVPALAGAGLVRAKTGSLNQVTALSGYVINSHGRLLVFSILGNGLTDGAAAARPVVDAAAAAVAGS